MTSLLLERERERDERIHNIGQCSSASIVLLAKVKSGPNPRDPL